MQTALLHLELLWQEKLSTQVLLFVCNFLCENIADTQTHHYTNYCAVTETTLHWLCSICACGYLSKYISGQSEEECTNRRQAYKHLSDDERSALSLCHTASSFTVLLQTHILAFGGHHDHNTHTPGGTWRWMLALGVIHNSTFCEILTYRTVLLIRQLLLVTGRILFIHAFDEDAIHWDLFFRTGEQVFATETMKPRLHSFMLTFDNDRFQWNKGNKVQTCLQEAKCNKPRWLAVFRNGSCNLLFCLVVLSNLCSLKRSSIRSSSSTPHGWEQHHPSTEQDAAQELPWSVNEVQWPLLTKGCTAILFLQMRWNIEWRNILEYGG